MGSTEQPGVSARLGRRQLIGTGAAAAAGGLLLARPEIAEAQSAPADSVFNVKAAPFNAAGNFWTNDTVAIQGAIDAAIAAGGGIVWFPPGQYRITGTLKLNGSSFDVFDKPVTLQGAGDASQIVVSNVASGGDPGWVFTGESAIEARGQDGSKVALGAGTSAGARQVVVPASVADDLVIGSILAIEENISSGWVYGTNGKPYELHKVVSKDNTTIDLDAPLLHTYTAAAVVYAVAAVQGPRVRDLAIRAGFPPESNPGVRSIVINRAHNAIVSRVRIYNAAGGILLQNVVDAHITDCTIDNLPKYDSSFGQGVTVAGASANVSIAGLVGRGCRHLFTTMSDQRGASDFYGGPRNVTVTGGVGDGGDVRAADNQGPLAVWDTHEYGTNISFIGCSANGVGSPNRPGFQVRAKRVKLVDCVSQRNAGSGVSVADSAEETLIHGGKTAHNGEHGVAAGRHTTVTGVEIHHNGQWGISWNGGGDTGRILVTNCHIHDNGTGGIREEAPSNKVPNVVVTGNIVPKGSSPDSVVGLGARSVIANNLLRGYGSGDGTSGLDSSVVKQNNVVGS